MKTIFILHYCYGVLMTFFYLSTNEFEKKPTWQSWGVAIFWPFALMGGAAYIVRLIFYDLLFKGVPRWYRRHKYVRSEEYRQKMEKLNTVFAKVGSK